MMGGVIVCGIAIPFLGTALGSACVFFTRRELSGGVQRALTGFAAGVMVAASFFSLLLPALDLSHDLGRWSFLPSVVGFSFGMVFLLLLDRVIPHLHMNAEKAEGPHCRAKKTTKMVLAVTLHNLPEGLAVGVVIAGASILFYLNGSMGLIYTITMLLCSFMVFESLDMAGTYTALLKIIGKGVDLADEILETEQMNINGEKIEPEKRDIELKNVGFSYDKKKVVDGVSLTIPEGTTAAFVGPSGGGKTTLCHLMARFWDVQEGEVLLGGRNVKDYDFDSLMHNFSFVFQSVYLFEDTIADNIRFGEPDASMDRVIEAAKKARCHDFITALPDGYDTVIGEGGASLSGGEKQRISIARAIMKDAPIIILDEATANVDPENEAELTAAIEELTREKTIIMIAHRLKTVRHADRIFVVDKGRIAQAGTHEELLKKDGIYRRFVEGRREAVSWKIGAGT